MNKDELNAVLVSLIEPVLNDAIEKAVQNIKERSKAEENDLCFIHEASEITGLALPTVYLKTSTNQIPHFKKGRRLYFSKKALREWIQSGNNETV